MTRKFKVYDLHNDMYIESGDVFISPEGEVLIIEECDWSHETYMRVEDITHKVRVEWES